MSQDAPEITPLLAAFATPWLYRQNAFRLTGLPVTASARDLARCLETLKLQERAGATNGLSGGVLSVDPRPDFDTVRNAVQALQKDPETRLIHEFFWLWPLDEGANQLDLAVALPGKGMVEAETAGQIYKDLMAKGGPHASIAQHNHAVFTHLLALDMEWQAEQQPLTAAQQDLCTRRHDAALAAWEAVRADDGVWRWLDVRVRAINDPRLIDETVSSLREQLPLVLCLIAARLAVRAAQRGPSTDTTAHVARLTQESVVEVQRDQALRVAIEPIREQITAICRRVESESEQDAEKGAEIAKTLLAETPPLLAIIDRVLPDTHLLREDAHDQVALTGLRMLIAYGNKTERWVVCLDLVEQCLAFAVSESARTRIQTNRDTFKANKERETCWFCEKGRAEDSIRHKVKIHGNVRHEGNQVQWDTRDVTVPRCKKCKNTHALLAKLCFLLSVIMTAALFGGVCAASEMEIIKVDIANALLLCIVFGFCLGVIVLRPVFLRIGLHGSKSRNSAKDSPQVQVFLTEGWQLEERPRGM